MDLFASLQTLISEGLLFFSLDQPLVKGDGRRGEFLSVKGREGRGRGQEYTTALNHPPRNKIYQVFCLGILVIHDELIKNPEFPKIPISTF